MVRVLGRGPVGILCAVDAEPNFPNIFLFSSDPIAYFALLMVLFVPRPCISQYSGLDVWRFVCSCFWYAGIGLWGPPRASCRIKA